MEKVFSLSWDDQSLRMAEKFCMQEAEIQTKGVTKRKLPMV